MNAGKLLKSYEQPGEVIEKIILLNRIFITEEDVKKIIKDIKNKKEDNEKKETDDNNNTNINSPKNEKGIIINSKNQVTNENIKVNRGNGAPPIAKEYEPDIKVISKYERSESKGEIGDFIKYFQYRFTKMSKLFNLIVTGNMPQIKILDTKRNIGQKVRMIVMIYSKNVSKKGNIVLHIEDLTGQFLAIVSKRNEKVYKIAQTVVEDDMVMLVGKVLEPYIIINEILFPDVPLTKKRKFSENDLATVYISDTHMGSRFFLDKVFNRFVKWINGNVNEGHDLANKVKYLVVAGDVVDGIGVYPHQEKELVELDIGKQYEMFNKFLENIPDYISVIVIPGNHDAVRRAEPMPKIPEEYLRGNIINVENPSWAKIEGLTHLIYHGTSFDSVISRVPKMSYGHPENVMQELLKRRHISPFYGGNLIVPEHVDHMIIEDAPDVFHAGHVHKNGYLMYRNSLIINSGTFQDRTPFQVKQGHTPTPGMIPVYEMKYGKLKTMNFME